MNIKPLSQILPVLGIQSFLYPDILINDVISDSRVAGPGSIFVAIPGEKTDGHRFIPEAVQRGSAIIIGTASDVSCSVPYIQVPDGREALALLSAALYDFPARKMQMIGVTGTDGKTTTTNLIFNILKTAGIKTGMISTVNARIGDEVIDTGFHVTTPDAPEIQRFLYRMVSEGLKSAIIETTSHGLEQKRVTGCEFDIGVLTNITHEHLDYHGTFEKYRDTKADLFRQISHTRYKYPGIYQGAVLNIDDDSYSFIKNITDVETITYGQSEMADLRSEDIKHSLDYLSFLVISDRLQGGFGELITSNLIGEYNIYNILAALGVTVGLMGIDIKIASKGIKNTPAVSGRMERIELGQNFIAIVDFAHTPNSLTKALVTIRNMFSSELRKRRIIAVFGSAGLRDRSKRRMMAEISAQYADITILTAEDPRTESLESILADMKNGIETQGGREGKSFWIIPDRGQAIEHAVNLAGEGDVVIVCGKGHEQSMCFGDVEYPWDDRTALQAAIARILGINGPEIPYLPTSRKRV